MEAVQPVYMNMYQIDIFRKDISWVHLHDEPRVQEKEQVKIQQFYITVSVAHPTNPSDNWKH